MDALANMKENGVPRDWKKRLAAAGIECSDRRGLWDLMHPGNQLCPICMSSERPWRKTNVARLETCGAAACRAALKNARTERTCLEIYGTRRPAQSEQVKAKAKGTSLERYGVSHPSQLQQFQDRRARTNLGRYGQKVPALAPIFREQAVQRRRVRMSEKYIAVGFPLFKQRLLERYEVQVLSEWQSKSPFTFKHLPCGTEWTATCSDGVPRCPTCGTSKEQRSVERVVRETGVQFRSNDRKVISPYELDIWVPKQKVAIEVNGWYWHQDGESTSLAKKTELAGSQGIRLLHFMDWECNEKPDIVRSHIRHALGATAEKLSARSCTLAAISSAAARTFLDQSHLAGFQAAKLHVGLRWKNELVAVMSVGKPRWGKADLEIIRWATKPATTVRGGFSRCLRFVLAELEPTTVLSFCDLRTGSGGVYAAAGFKLDGITPPNYTWCKGNQRLTRYQTQKHMLQKLLGLAFDPTRSEQANMEACGWSKVSDSGNQRWFLVNRKW